MLKNEDKFLLLHGDCAVELEKIATASIDSVVTDPPYPQINRDYGTLTEPQWHEMMRKVITECRRVLKPTGSAVFILQPNSETVGRMRPWLWEFMAWTAKEWNQIQDVWWWNPTALPTVHVRKNFGLMRPSIKACVWLGNPDCFRNQDAILWTETERNKMQRAQDRSERVTYASGHSVNHYKCGMSAVERGGVTPFNLIPLENTVNKNKHPAHTPYNLCKWWINYITPVGGTILDCFMGSGTTGCVAAKDNMRYIGIEKDSGWFESASQSISAEYEKRSADLF